MSSVTTSTSWGGNIKKAFGGVIIGFLLFVGAFPLLWWNEGRAAKTYAGLDELSEVLVELASPVVEAANQGEPIYVTGEAETNRALRDGSFGININDALRLRRQVEMYQWVEDQSSETRDKLGGGSETITTYSYRKDWSSSPVNSTNFNDRVGHENPPMTYQSETFNAGDATLGEFSLDNEVLNQFDDFRGLDAAVIEGFSVSGGSGNRGKIGSAGGWHPEGEQLYSGSDSSNPVVGDMRVSFSEVPTGAVSVIGQQQGNGFSPWVSSKDISFLLAGLGTKSAGELISVREGEEKIMTWIIRVAGFIMMFFGLKLVFAPLSALVRIIPFASSLVGFVGSAIAFFIALIGWTLTVAIAWIAYRPLVAIPLLIIAAGGVYGLFKMGRKAREERLASPDLAADVPPAAPSTPPPIQKSEA